MTTEPVLDARELVFTHPGGTSRALDGVSLRVGAGECVGLLGPNGAGKTTFVGCATGLLTPQSGRVRICGGDPRHGSTRQHIGVVLQGSAYPRHLTVRELVGGAAVRAGLPAAAADPVLEEVGLTELARRRAGRLSGGQQQRLQLARALVTEPRLLVLDEPTVGLDPTARRWFWDHLSARRDRGMAILLTTHLIDEAGAVADRVAVIAQGRLVADADPRQLANRLPNRTISVTTTLDVAAVAGLPGVLSAKREGATLHLVSDAPEQVVHHLLHRDPELADLRVEGASLEEAVSALAARPLASPVVGDTASAAPTADVTAPVEVS